MGVRWREWDYEGCEDGAEGLSEADAWICTSLRDLALGRGGVSSGIWESGDTPLSLAVLNR